MMIQLDERKYSMNTIIELWYVWVTVLAVGLVIGYNVKAFLEKPHGEQIQAIKDWAVKAIVEAMAAWGSDADADVILREAYDAFIKAFPSFAKYVSYEKFKSWTLESLEKAKEIIEKEPIVKAYVGE